MKPSASPPDWSLLPHNPVGFFELSNDFDRKTLKRKYNQLIRQYKPEKAPAEFQKIRAAYELLDGRLRYGASPAAPAKPSFEWEAAQSKSPTTKKPPTPKTDQAAELIEPLVAKVVEVPIYQRVETESPLKC